MSFAQFKREIISERTKDKMGAARKKGKWVGGLSPLGYDLDRANKKLVINPKEAEIIRMIFDLYIHEKSLLAVARRLNEKGLTTKSYKRKTGTFGGVKFSTTNIQMIIKNYVYTGKVFYCGEIYPGLHEAIIPEEVFQKAHEILALNRKERGISKNTKSLGILSGLIRCKDCNVAMYHTYSKKEKFKYLYYVCVNSVKRGRKDCPTKSISADKTEETILGILRQLSQEPRLKEKVWKGLALEERVGVVKTLLKEADYSAKDAILGLVLQNEEERREFKIEVKDLKHVPTSKKEAIKNEPKVRQNLALAHQIEELLDTGKINDVKQLTGHLNMSHARTHQLMAMTLLAPSIQEDILLGENERLSEIPEYKLREITSETDWQIQRNLWDKLLPPIPAAN